LLRTYQGDDLLFEISAVSQYERNCITVVPSEKQRIEASRRIVAARCRRQGFVEMSIVQELADRCATPT
jgi:hypothetical protein